MIVIYAYADVIIMLMKIPARRRGEMLLRVLRSLEHAVVAISRHPTRTSSSVYRIIRDFRELQDLSDRQIRNISRYVVRNKYITIRKDGASRLEISENGQSKIVEQSLRTLKPPTKQPWDGRWRIVLFDVPNQLKKQRDRFAALLKQFGFEHLQKSAFITPFPCEEEIEVIADYLNIQDCVDVIVAENISRADEFKKAFKVQ